MPVIYGKGGGGGGGSSSTATESPDSLTSKSYVTILDMLGEGEWEEVGVGGLRGIYLDDVPIQNSDGTLNFKDVKVETRKGTVNQTPLKMQNTTDSVEQVGVEMVYNVPIERSISNPDTDIVRVAVNIPQLTQMDSAGNINGSTVEYKVEYKPSDSADWITVKEGTRQYIGATLATTTMPESVTGYSSYSLGITINPWQFHYYDSYSDSGSGGYDDSSSWSDGDSGGYSNGTDMGDSGDSGTGFA